MTGLPDANQIAARLDRLPPSAFHRCFLVAIALGASFDYYDNFVAGSLALFQSPASCSGQLRICGGVRAGHVGSGDYTAEHWLASFTVYMLSTRKGEG